MKLYEKHIELFTVDNSFHLAHCISSDFVLEAGIAIEFDKRFDMRNKLFSLYPNYKFIDGTCLPVENVFNLVTKEKYNHKPTYENLRYALMEMKYPAIRNGVNKIALPRIGCGSDKLEWYRVKRIIYQMFEDTNMEIVVCNGKLIHRHVRVCQICQ